MEPGKHNDVIGYTIQDASFRLVIQINKMGKKFKTL